MAEQRRVVVRSRRVVILLAATAAVAVAVDRVRADVLPGGVYVERIGGTGGFGAGSTPGDTTTQLPLFIDGFAIGGSAPQATISVPTTDSLPNYGMTNTASGAGNIPFGEGYLQSSPSGRFLAIAGYGAGAAVSTTKVLGSLDVTNGSLNTGTTFSLTNGPRSALTPDGSNFYFSGSGNGIRYVTPVASGTFTGTSISINPANQRVVSIFGGQLFVDGNASNGGATGGNPGIAVIGSGAPTVATSTGMKYIMTTSANSEQFVMLDQDPNVGFVNSVGDPANPFDTKLDVTYVATDAGVEKWTYNGTAWTRQYILTGGLGTSSKVTVNMAGVTFVGKDAAGNNVLYGTTQGSLTGTGQGNALVKIADTGAGASWQVVTLSPDNTWLRGLATVKMPGDANGDWVVDTLDFNALAANFGGTQKNYSQGDFNYDGVVDTLDFNSLAANFGKGGGLGPPLPGTSGAGGAGGAGPGSAVPEPATLGLIAVPATLALRRRRRRR